MDEIVEVFIVHLRSPYSLCSNVSFPLKIKYCQGVKVSAPRSRKVLAPVLTNQTTLQLVLVALKCDLRDDPHITRTLSQKGMHTCQYEEGLAVARRIRASRYLGMFPSHLVVPS